MPSNDFELEVRSGSRPDQTIIAPKRALVLEHIFKFQEAWRQAQRGNIILDLAGVNYLDSSAIGSLVNAHVACDNRNHKLILAGVPERVRQMLTVTKVDKLFTFLPDVAGAEKTLNGASA